MFIQHLFLMINIYHLLMIDLLRKYKFFLLLYNFCLKEWRGNLKKVFVIKGKKIEIFTM